MAPFQSSYTQYMSAGVAGMKVDSREDEVESFAAEGAVSFGAPVVAGTDTAVQVKQGTGTFRGVALRTSAVSRQASGTDGYADTDAVNVLRKGMVWVPVLEDVAADGAVTRSVATSGDTAGKWGTATGTAVTNGVWRSAGTSGGLAKLELILPAVVS
jgi:hypothetical protein